MGRRDLGRQGDELLDSNTARSRGQAMYVSRACGAIIGRADADCSGAPQLALEGRCEHGEPGQATTHSAQGGRP
jgi:hypothetical protein